MANQSDREKLEQQQQLLVTWIRYQWSPFIFNMHADNICTQNGSHTLQPYVVITSEQVTSL